ncbi:hypothetical protein DFJ74DRAFT_755553 [Hyaloraphidium curvatum]|nr:hypothetical protein DFJ74DRAFT_755553 [Hyaloraphidium curvatum]
MDQKAQRRELAAEKLEKDALAFKEALADPVAALAGGYLGQDPRSELLRNAAKARIGASRHIWADKASADEDRIVRSCNVQRDLEGLDLYTVEQLREIPLLADNLKTLAPTLRYLVERPYTADFSSISGLEFVGVVPLAPWEGSMDGSSDDDDHRGDREDNTSGPPAEFYVRRVVYGSAADQQRDFCRYAINFPADAAHFAVQLPYLLAEAELYNAGETHTTYFGWSTAVGPQERCQQDLAAVAYGTLNSRLGNFFRSQQCARRIEIWRFTGIRVDEALADAPTLKKQLDQNSQHIERIAICSQYPSTLNSDLGGFAPEPLRIDEDLLLRRNAVDAWEASKWQEVAKLSGARSLDVRPQLVTNLDVGLTMRSIKDLCFRVLSDFKDMGPEPDLECFRAAIARAGTVPIVSGELVNFLLFHDVSRQGHQERYAAGFQNRLGLMGRGPLEFELTKLAANPSIPCLTASQRNAMSDAEYAHFVASSFGPMTDSWWSSLVHDPAWVGLVNSSLILKALRPIHIEGYSAESAGSMLNHLLRDVWRPGISPALLLDNLRDDFGPDSLDHWESLIDMEKVGDLNCRKLKLQNLLEFVDITTIAPFGPDQLDLALFTPHFDHGRVKKDPLLRKLVRRVNYFAALGTRVTNVVVSAQLLAGDVPPRDADAAALKIYLEKTLELVNGAKRELGISGALELEKKELAAVESWAGSSRIKTARLKHDVELLDSGKSAADIIAERSELAEVNAAKRVSKEAVTSGQPDSAERRDSVSSILAEVKKAQEFGLPAKLTASGLGAVPKQFRQDPEAAAAYLNSVPEDRNLTAAARVGVGDENIARKVQGPAKDKWIADRKILQAGVPKGLKSTWTSQKAIKEALQYLVTKDGLFGQQGKPQSQHPLYIFECNEKGRCDTPGPVLGEKNNTFHRHIESGLDQKAVTETRVWWPHEIAWMGGERRVSPEELTRLGLVELHAHRVLNRNRQLLPAHLRSLDFSKINLDHGCVYESTKKPFDFDVAFLAAFHLLLENQDVAVQVPDHLRGSYVSDRDNLRLIVEHILDNPAVLIRVATCGNKDRKCTSWALRTGSGQIQHKCKEAQLAKRPCTVVAEIGSFAELPAEIQANIVAIARLPDTSKTKTWDKLRAVGLDRLFGWNIPKPPSKKQATLTLAAPAVKQGSKSSAPTPAPPTAGPPSPPRAPAKPLAPSPGRSSNTPIGEKRPGAGFGEGSEKRRRLKENV